MELSANIPVRVCAAVNAAMPEPVVITGMSNQEFLERYAGAGRIGLSGGVTLIDNVIARAERHLDETKTPGSWSHAFLFQGTRADGHHWVIESDIQAHRKHIQIGVQENRISKYFNQGFYTTLAVLDFGLRDEHAGRLIAEGLELAATHARYSLRELLGTYLALKHPKLRERDNVFARENSLYCSAFIQQIFRKTGIDLAPGVHGKNTTPEDIFRSLVPHATYLLQRPLTPGPLVRLRSRVRKRVDVGIQRLKKTAKKT